MNIDKEKGSVLIVTLLVMAVLASFGIGFYVTSNTNMLTSLNEIEGEKLNLVAESGARIAISIYKKESGPVKILSWKNVQSINENKFKKLAEGVINNATYEAMYDDSETGIVKFLGKGIKKGKEKDSFIVKRVLVSAKKLGISPTPTPTSIPTPDIVVNSGHKNAYKTLREAIKDAPSNGIIEVVQTDKENNKAPIIIDKPLHIIGVYKPTKGYGGNNTMRARTLVNVSMIIKSDNVTIEGLYLDPDNYNSNIKAKEESVLGIDESKNVRSAESKTGYYIESKLDNGIVTDDPNSSSGSKLPVPKHNKAVIIVKGSNVVIRNNVIARGKGSYDVGIYVAIGSQNVLIDHNTFVDTKNINHNKNKRKKQHNKNNGNTAVVINNIDRDSYVTITNNIFAYSKDDYAIGVEMLGERGVNTDKDGEPLVQCVDNDFWNNTLALGNLEGVGVYGLYPGFVSWEDGIFTLASDSPLKETGREFGVNYESQIFRNITIVDWNNIRYFDSLEKALEYEIDGAKIRVDKEIPIFERKNKEFKKLFQISQNNLTIYSAKGPKEDTRIPLIVDIEGDNITIEGLKFELTESAINYFLKNGFSYAGMGVLNIGATLLTKENPFDFWKNHQHHCHHGCNFTEGINFTLNNSIIVRPSNGNNIAGISVGYGDLITLKHLVITSLGVSASGDGVRFIGSSKSGGGICHCFGNSFKHYGRGKIVITDSIIAGYIENIEKYEISGITTSPEIECKPTSNVNCGICGNCNILEENGSCNNASFVVCEISKWNLGFLWNTMREIDISNSDIWGNECAIKYTASSFFGNLKEEKIVYTNIASIDPGFVFNNVPESQMFKIGDTLRECKPNIGIEWESFSQ